MTTPFFRVRWILRARSKWELPPVHLAVLYALFADANRSDDTPPGIPDALLLDAPEQCRLTIDAGETFACGATVVEADVERASELIARLTRGLERLGREMPNRQVAIGGNFEVVGIEDLVVGLPHASGELLFPIPIEHIAEEVERAVRCESLTLRFLSPLRLDRPGVDAVEGHRHIDRDFFKPGQFLRHLQKRLAAVGLVPHDEGADPPFENDGLELLDNRLVWLDIGYGARQKRKSLGGVLGRVRLRVSNARAVAALVWGQYARAGRNLHFGLGRYRIEELGPEPFACRRERSLLEVALSPLRATEPAADEAIAGTYRPDQPYELVMKSAEGSTRRLRIPSNRDRLIQRAILATLGPAVDKLFETSSFAWRAGLSRDSAARRIARLFEGGWQFALRADFDRFFDRIDRQSLLEKLEAWLSDDEAAQAIFRMVCFAEPGRDERGVATGAPLSPLVGNLLLDEFDERIDAAGGKLVRYADDFLILCRTAEEAERLHAVARAEADRLLLSLNDDAVVLDLSEGFEFLGYRFTKSERWSLTAPGGPRRVDDLGWKQASRRDDALAIVISGEEGIALESGGAIAVAGPGLERIDLAGERLVFDRGGAAPPRELNLDDIETLLVMGPADLSGQAWRGLLGRSTPMLFLSESGWPLGRLDDDLDDDPAILFAQCDAGRNPLRALEIARILVVAKLRNHAALSRALSERANDSTATKLLEFAERAAKAASLDELRGHEGAGAAAWYRRLPSFLGRGFHFPGRVAPDAADPINLVLNLANTQMHRLAIAAARLAGLSPAVGFLHAPTNRFAALAADLQEPFRHLAERVAILASRALKLSQFLRKDDGRYPLVLEHHASLRVQEFLQRSLRTKVARKGESEARSFLQRMLAQARSLRRHLLDSSKPFEAFEHP